MSGQLQYIKGDRLYFCRKEEGWPATVIDVRPIPTQFGAFQLLTRDDAGKEMDWTHEAWFVFTWGEMAARIDRYNAAESGKLEAAAAEFAKGCPSTHCNRREECATPNDCIRTEKTRAESEEKAVRS